MTSIRRWLLGWLIFDLAAASGMAGYGILHTPSGGKVGVILKRTPGDGVGLEVVGDDIYRTAGIRVSNQWVRNWPARYVAG